jgi:integrase
MGVYERPDSPFLWLLLERPSQKPIREATTIPKAGASQQQTRELVRQATEIYNHRMIELARRRHKLPVDLQARTFAQHRVWYVEHVTASKRSAVRERSMIRQLARFFDRYQLAAIDQSLVLEWRTGRMAQVSASTTRREEIVLKHMLTMAVPKFLDANPLLGQRRIRVAESDTRILSEAEERRLLKALRTDEDRALIIGAMDTLLRLGNIAMLTRRQDHRTYLFSDTKVGAVRIPISTRFRRALDRLARADAPGALAYFPTYARQNDATRNNMVITMFMDACRRARVATGRKTGGVSFHCLRHTGASRMLAAGVDVKTVMEIGGWKNLSVMQRYLHPTDERKREAVNAIGRRRRRA